MQLGCERTVKLVPKMSEFEPSVITSEEDILSPLDSRWLSCASTKSKFEIAFGIVVIYTHHIWVHLWRHYIVLIHRTQYRWRNRHSDTWSGLSNRRLAHTQNPVSDALIPKRSCNTHGNIWGYSHKLSLKTISTYRHSDYKDKTVVRYILIEVNQPPRCSIITYACRWCLLSTGP